MICSKVCRNVEASSATVRPWRKVKPELKDSLPKPIPMSRRRPTLDPKMSPEIETAIPGILAKQLRTDEVLRALALEHIHYNPSKKWTDAYTDGSAAEATKDGGGGILIKFKTKEEKIAISTGRYSSNFKAKATALQEVAKRLKRGRNKAKKRKYIFSNALAVLEAFKNPRIRSEDLDPLTTSLTKPFAITTRR